jgi:hypothetical protein
LAAGGFTNASIKPSSKLEHSESEKKAQKRSKYHVQLRDAYCDVPTVDGIVADRGKGGEQHTGEQVSWEQISL